MTAKVYDVGAFHLIETLDGAAQVVWFWTVNNAIYLNIV